PGALRQRSRDLIARLEADVPGSRHGLLHSMDSIRELQIEAKGGHKSTEWASEWMQKCGTCGGASSQSLCQACIMRKWLKQTDD
ncbi:MAG TPA: hypothetical protein QF621_01550, partial [Candidatus Thalassarchaeaceae archaeon]|nr:hypothetical protein [Candidatus Thalassarchaeaceae archaeon]